MSNTQRSSSYYAGFDYIRAVLSLAVIAIHTRLLSAHGNLSVDERSGFNVFDIIELNLFFLAVPLFFLVSLFLFYKKQSTLVKDGRRVYQILILYAFWSAAWVLFRDTRPKSGLSEILVFIISGGESVFWFFFSLAFVTLVAALTRKLSTQLTWIALCTSTLMIALFPILNMQDANYRYLVAFWNPLLFVPCVFAAKLFVRYEDAFKSRKYIQPALLVIFIGLCILEWLTLIHPNHELVQAIQIPYYARPSVLVGAFILFISALRVRARPPAVIKFLSSVSLGLYCMHPFLISLTSEIGRRAVGIEAIAYFLCITAASLAATYLFKSILRERLI